MIENGEEFLQNNDGDTALHLAVRCGYSNVAKSLIDFGFDIMLQNLEGDTALHCAMRGIDEREGKASAWYLLEAGAFIDVENNGGETPETIALDHHLYKYFYSQIFLSSVLRGDNVMVKNMLLRGVDINSKTHLGLGPLHLLFSTDLLSSSGEEKLIAMVKLLLGHGASLILEDSLGRTPLSLAGTKGLLQSLGGEMFLSAAESGSEENISLLLDKGVNVNYLDPESGGNVFHILLRQMAKRVEERYQYIDAVRLVINKGVNTVLLDGDAVKPIDLIKSYGEDMFFKLLCYSVGKAGETGSKSIIFLSSNANLEKIERENSFLEHVKQLDTLSLLPSIGETVDVNVQDCDGNSGLSLAIISAHNTRRVKEATLLVGNLLKKGANPDLKNLLGDAPLHFAAEYGLMELAKLLFDSGATYDLEDRNGNTPYALTRNKESFDEAACLSAVDKNNIPLLKYLVMMEKVTASCVDDKGNTAWHLVVESIVKGDFPLEDIMSPFWDQSLYSYGRKISSFSTRTTVKQCDAFNSEGYTPLQLAILNGGEELVDFFDRK